MSVFLYPTPMKLIFYLWQLPQHLLALFLILVFRVIGSEKLSQPFPLIITRVIGNMGLSLGQYIFLGEDQGQITLKHEIGHSYQSRRLGPLYLLLVGLPSISRNIWQRIFHKGWTNPDRQKWYYGSYPEKGADKLGGVIRK